MACQPHTASSQPARGVSPTDLKDARGILFEIENHTMQIRALGHGIDIIAASVFSSDPEVSRSIMAMCDYLQKEITTADTHLSEARSLLGEERQFHANA